MGVWSLLDGPVDHSSGIFALVGCARYDWSVPDLDVMKPAICRLRPVRLHLVIAGITSLHTAGAMDIIVANNADAGNDTLRQAIQFNESLGGGNRIVFSNAVTGTITLTNVLGELLITKDVTIVGPGANVLTISGNNSHRVFEMSNATVNISGLAISHGAAVGDYAGGIYVRAGCNLNLSNCTISGNYATAPGGGILIESTAMGTLASCTISGNTGVDGGGLEVSGAVAMTNCTIYGNTANTGIGGGLHGSGSIVNCTICGNSAKDFGGGVSSGSAIVRNTVIAGNTAPLGGPDCAGIFTSQGFNLIGAINGSSGWGAVGDQLGTTNSYLNPMLGPLQDNGGPTFTMRPLPGSPVLDQGNSSGIFTDQRGHSRPYTNSPSASIPLGGDHSDIGAYEISPAILIVSNSNDGGTGSLRQAVATSSPVDGGDIIRFASNVVGTITLTAGELTLTNNLSILGPGAKLLAINGNNSNPIFDILSGNISISGLTICSGRATGADGSTEQNGFDGRGGGIYNQGNLALSACTIVSNTAVGGGGGPTVGNVAGSGGAGLGGGIYTIGALSLTDCLICTNTALGGPGGQAGSGSAGGGGNAEGGGICNLAGTLTITRCTFADDSSMGGGGGTATGGGSPGNGGQGYGGGLYTDGLAAATNSTFNANSAIAGTGGGGTGGGVGGGILNNLNLVLFNCTVASNSAAGSSFDFGGGIHDQGTNLLLRCCTLAGNQADYGGGLSADGSSIDLGNTLLAANSINAGSVGPDCSGTFVSSDYNLIGNTAGATITGATSHNILGQDPLLGPLQDNGGPNLTMALLPGSPAIDQGKSFGATTDQRGRQRPFDFATIPNAPGGDGSDIGAYEVNPPILSIVQAGNMAILSWSTSDTGYTLESKTNLGVASGWTTVSNSPVIVANNFTVTNDTLVSSRVYRLKNP